MSIGKRIRDIRKRQKITQKELAMLLEYSQPTAISYIENGQRRLKAQKLPKLAECLGVSIEEILGCTIEEIFFTQNVVIPTSETVLER